MAFEKPAVVIDNGSRYMKAGFACDNHPVAMFRTVVARPRNLIGMYGRAEHYEVYTGDEAVDREKELNLNSPVVNGKIVHWDNIERIWHHIFYRELKVAPEDRAVIICCSPNTPFSEKVKACQVFFEVLNTPALSMQNAAGLALFGSGVTTGITVDIGYDTTDVNPVYEGGVIGYAQISTGYSGRQICDYFTGSLADRHVNLGFNSAEILDGVMKDCLYVTPNTAMSRRGYERYMKNEKGEKVDISQESFLASEMFFQPDLVMGRKTSYKSLTDSLIDAAKKCDPDLRDEMYSSIVMSGGLSMIPGIGPRLQAEVSARLEKPVTVMTSDESYAVAWMGAAALAGLPEAQRLFVTQKQFEDYGERIVRNRFL